MDFLFGSFQLFIVFRYVDFGVWSVVDSPEFQDPGRFELHYKSLSLYFFQVSLCLLVFVF